MADKRRERRVLPAHKGKFRHEFLEFEFHPDSKLCYVNNSNYKKDTMIRKEIFLNPAVLNDYRDIVSNSDEDDNDWSEPDRVRRQKLEIVMGNEHLLLSGSGGKRSFRHPICRRWFLVRAV